MIKRYDKEMRNPGPFLPQRLMLVERTNGPFVLASDCDVLLALIAEMKDLLTYTAPFCNARGDYAACMRLAARAEELLRD